APAAPKSALRGDELEGAQGQRSEPTGRNRSESAARSKASEEDEAPAASRIRGDAARVQDVNTAATPEFTRVTIQLEDRVEYSSARLQNPERIFFDLHTAKLTPEAARKAVHVEGALLTAVRVAQYHAGIVRVVLDVRGVKDYVASLAGSPPRLVIDLYPG